MGHLKAGTCLQICRQGRSLWSCFDLGRMSTLDVCPILSTFQFLFLSNSKHHLLLPKTPGGLSCFVGLAGLGAVPYSERREQWEDGIWQCLVVHFLHWVVGGVCDPSGCERVPWRPGWAAREPDCAAGAFVCLLFRGTHLGEQQSLEVLEQTVQSRHSVVSLAAGGGFASRSRGWGGDLVYQPVLLCLQRALPCFTDCK